MSKTRTKNPEVKSGRKHVFGLLTLIFPILLLLLMEGFLRLFSYGDNLRLFIPIPREGYEAYMMANPMVGKKYFQDFQFDTPANDIFLKEKPEGTFRIFVMGSSTVLGFPYGDNLMFSRILHLRLKEAFPDKTFEVVNTAITAINSFTLADYAKQVARHQPDAVLVYAGHNEFYGAFGVGSNEGRSGSSTITRMHLKLMDLRLYQLLRNITASTMEKIKSGDSEQLSGTLMKRIVADQSISQGSESYLLAMKRFRQNMEDVLAAFETDETHVFLSQVISNLQDQKPFSALSSGKENDALRTYNRAALAFEQQSYEEARELFTRAKDQDGVRFRASEDVNRIIHELAREYDVHEIPMLDYYQEASPRGISGSALLTEHVHPNIAGNFVMADAFFSEILQSGILGEPEKENMHSSHYHMLNWGYTELDTLQAYHRITNLKKQWPFVPAEEESSIYRSSYKPVSELDSLAFLTVADTDQSLSDLRLAVARAYENLGKHEKAFGEYNALLHTNPYLAVNYRDAASSLIWLGDLPMAMAYFRESLKLEPSSYAHFRMGEICLIKADYSSARKHFEEAFSLSEDEEEKLKILGKIYMSALYKGQEKSARAVANQLRKYGAERFLKIPPRTYTYLNYVPYQTRTQVNSALQLWSENRMDEALEILQNSLDVYDSHVARRYIGEISLALGNMAEARVQFEKVYEEFRFDPAFMTLYDSLKN